MRSTSFWSQSLVQGVIVAAVRLQNRQVGKSDSPGCVAPARQQVRTGAGSRVC